MISVENSCSESLVTTMIQRHCGNSSCDNPTYRIFFVVLKFLDIPLFHTSFTWTVLVLVSLYCFLQNESSILQSCPGWHQLLLSSASVRFINRFCPHASCTFRLCGFSMSCVYIPCLCFHMNMQHVCLYYFLCAVSRDVIVPEGGQSEGIRGLALIWTHHWSG